MFSALFVSGLSFASICSVRQPPPPVPIWQDDANAAGNQANISSRLYLSRDRKDLIVLIRDSNTNRLVPKTIPLNIRFVPTIRASVGRKANQNDSYVYTYSLANKKAARDPICSIYVVVSPKIESSSVAESSKGWVGSVGMAEIARQAELETNDLGRFVFWTGRGLEETAHAVLPDTSTSGFTIETKLLPGLTTAYLHGKQIDVEEGGVDGVEVTPVTSDFRWHSLSVLTVGPMFSESSPCSSILKNYLLGLKRLAECSEIPHDQSFIEKLTTLLQKEDACENLGTSLSQFDLFPANGIDAEIVSALKIVASAKSVQPK
jgi:hypothetical protein